MPRADDIASRRSYSIAQKPPQSPQIIKIKPASHLISILLRRSIFCRIAVSRNPTRVETDVASKIGMKTSVGRLAPICARYIKIVIGIRVTEEAFNIINRICASLAVSFCGLCSCSCFMAFRPIGVAALSSPRKLAAIFRTTVDIAGLFSGMSFIRTLNSGVSLRDIFSAIPASSISLSIPSQKLKIPASPIQISTAFRAFWKMASVRREKLPLS